MSASIFSSSWYRVAGLAPRLRSHAEIHRVLYRGQRWYLLQDHTSGRFHRFSPAAHALIGLMNGRRTLAEIWSLASQKLGDDLPTQDETIRLLAQLYHANALVTDAPSDVAELVERDASVRRRRFWSGLRSPLAIKIPLWDPERTLQRAMPFVRPVFSRAGLAIWLAVVGLALVLAMRHWEGLSEGVADRVLAAENLLLLWLSFPVVKLLHELGHAFAVKRWGGETHELGVMFLVGVPVPYVDASASSAFASRRQRALVGAAGIFVELFIAALALFAWLAVEPGAARAILFNVMLIAGVSSLFFNGNPFLRFDAYYVLSDLLEIPNLGARANQYWGHWIQHRLFGRPDAEDPVTEPGEAPWLAFYAIGALLNRLLVTLSIALFVATRLFFVGVLIALWSISQFAIWPMLRHLRFVLFDRRLRGRRRRAIAWSVGILAAVGGLLVLAPAPSWTRAEGVVWAREDSLLRAGTNGVWSAYLARPGDRVERGEALVQLVDPELAAEREIARAHLAASRAQYALDRTRDRVQAEISRQSVEHAERRLARAEEELRALTIVAPSTGVFLVEEPADRIGRFVRRGEIVGYVVDFEPLIVRVAVPASSVDLVRHRTERVDVRMAERLDRIEPARVVLEVPSATDLLPSLALATEGGGSIALAPEREGAARAFERHFLFDLAVDVEQPPVGIGGRVYVRFAHEPEPVASQLYRAVRRLFLSQLDV
ncbi:MAG: efflux RND transporter periplasmic adaptor subunit [bacterium]